jgi:hypothetical protein
MIVTAEYYFNEVNNINNGIFHKSNIIKIVFLSILLYISNTTKIFWARFTFENIAIIMTYYFLCEKNIKNSIINFLVFYIHLLFLDLLTTYIIQNNLNVKILLKYSDWIKILTTNIYCLILVTLLRFKKYKIIIQKTTKNLSTYFSTIFLLIIISLTYVFMSGILYIGTINKLSYNYLIGFFFLCTSLFLFIVYIIFKIQNVKLSVKKLIEINDMYSRLIDNDKQVQHNIKNHLLSVKLIGNKKTNDYIDNLLQEMNTKPISKELYKLPKVLKGIFGNKLYYQDKFDIMVLNECKTKILENLNVKIYKDLCEIINITIDNIMETCNQTNQPYMYITVSETSDKILINIKNNFDGTIDADNLGTKKYSTKDRGSGYGLYSINKIKSISTSYALTENEFSTKISIKKSKVR